jgi:uncharacterized NAD-dependent epimerase/dehydratase family protein
MEDFDKQAIIDETERMFDDIKKLVRESTKRKGSLVSQSAAINTAIEMLAVAIAPTTGKNREALVDLIMGNLAKQINKFVSRHVADNVIQKAKKE